MKTTYVDFILEYIHSLTEQELMEMANITSKYTGIENIVLWVGPNPKTHGYRIKVSNVPNKFDGKDCFTLTIPRFEIIGERDKSIISNDTLNKIEEFIELNIDLIKQYSDYEIDTGSFIENLKY